jgi:hypothetical protein
MLLLHDNPAAFTNVSPDQMQKVVEKYIAWGRKLRDAGVIKAGDKVIDGPYSESKEVLGGYYMIEAGSYDKAIDHARDCPHLDYGGTIEVRQVDVM